MPDPTLSNGPINWSNWFKLRIASRYQPPANLHAWSCCFWRPSVFAVTRLNTAMGYRVHKHRKMLFEAIRWSVNTGHTKYQAQLILNLIFSWQTRLSGWVFVVQYINLRNIPLFYFQPSSPFHFFSPTTLFQDHKLLSIIRSTSLVALTWASLVMGQSMYLFN